MKIKTLALTGILTGFTLLTAPFATASPADSGADPASSTLAEQIETYRATQQQLLDERRQLAEKLREKSATERRRAIRQYQEANAARLAAHRALGEQIRSAVKRLRPKGEALQPGDGSGPSAEVQNLKKHFNEEREKLLERRRRILSQFRDVSREEREKVLEEVQQTVDEQRVLARQAQEK